MYQTLECATWKCEWGMAFMCCRGFLLYLIQPNFMKSKNLLMKKTCAQVEKGGFIELYFHLIDLMACCIYVGLCFSEMVQLLLSGY